MDRSFFVYGTSFLVGFFSFIFIYYVICKMPSRGGVDVLLKVCFDQRASLECVFIMNHYIKIIFHPSIPFFLSFHPYLIFLNPKITFLPFIKGF